MHIALLFCNFTSLLVSEVFCRFFGGFSINNHAIFGDFYINNYAIRLKIVLFFPYQSVFPFISFSYLSALAKTSSTLLNRSGNREYLFFTSHLRGKTSSLSPVSLTFAVDFLKVLFVKFRKFSILSLLSICHSWVLGTVKGSFCIN